VKNVGVSLRSLRADRDDADASDVVERTSKCGHPLATTIHFAQRNPQRHDRSRV
jgi:hypothetical protein